MSTDVAVSDPHEWLEFPSGANDTHEWCWRCGTLRVSKRLKSGASVYSEEYFGGGVIIEIEDGVPKGVAEEPRCEPIFMLLKRECTCDRWIGITNCPVHSVMTQPAEPMTVTQDGMSQRLLLAAMVMQGILAGPWPRNFDEATTQAPTGKRCFQIADDLLAAEKESEKGPSTRIEDLLCPVCEKPVLEGIPVVCIACEVAFCGKDCLGIPRDCPAVFDGKHDAGVEASDG